jgi:hypothetical protein
VKKIIICLFLLSTVLYAREIQILSSKVVDVEDETIALVEKRVFYVLDSLGLKVAKKADLSLRTEMIQLDDGEYLLNFEMTQGGKVLRSKREQLKSLQYMDVFVSDLLEEMLNTQIEDYEEDNRVEVYKKNQSNPYTKDIVLKGIFEEDKDERRFYDDEEESFAEYLVAGVFIIAYKLTLHILVSLSDYIGLEASLGGISAFSLSDEGANSSMDYKVGAQVRSSLFFGFNERHSWGFGLNFAKNPSEILNQYLSFLSTHRFYVNKYFFFDFVWGYGFFWYDAPLQIDESLQLGWSFGGDVGYNIIQGKKHWLSLVIGFQHIPRDDMAEKDELSLNLVYTFRGYFEE